MDIELLRTFLAVSQARHFGKAAENLFLTPAAVSARIRQLEHTLGATLFHRTRGNIQMTSAGEKLLPHAKKLLAAWVEAQADLALKPEPAAQLKIGSINGLWPLMQHLLDAIERSEPRLLSLESHTSAELLSQLAHQRLDLALLLDIPAHPDIKTLEFCELRLGQFISAPTARNSLQTSVLDIHMDWGMEFASKQQKQPGAKPERLITCNDLQLTLSWMQKTACRAYLPLNLAPHQTVNLQPVTTTPVVTLPVYLAYRTTSEHATMLESLLATLLKDH